MKKIILTILLLTCVILPSFAEDTNKIANIYLRNLEVVNQKEYVDYSENGLKIFADTNINNSSIDYDEIGAKVIYYNNEKRKIGQKILQNLFFNGHFMFDISSLPSDVDSYKIIPVKSSSIDYYRYIKNTLTSVIFSLNLGYDMSDMFSAVYNTPERLLNTETGILSELGNFKQSYPNGYMLASGTQIFLRSLNKSCKNFNKDIDERPSVYNACAEVTIDVNGMQLPNEMSNEEEIKDRFRFLLYADSLVPYKNSVEEKIMEGSPINAVVSNILVKEMYYDYCKFIKNLEITYTSFGIELIANNNSNKIQKANIQIKFYNKLGEIVDTYEAPEPFEIYPNNKDGTPISIGFNPNTLNNKDINYFDVIITNK